MLIYLTRERLQPLVLRQRIQKFADATIKTYPNSQRIKKFHSGDCILKFPDSATEFAGFVWTQAVSEKENCGYKHDSG